MSIKAAYIRIEKSGNIHYGVDFFYTVDSKSDSSLACYIPAYDAYFSCPNDEQKMMKRANAFVQVFYNFWRSQGSKQLFLQLHKLGWRTENHSYNLQRLLKGERFEVKFTPVEVGKTPHEFEESIHAALEGELVAA